MTYPCGQCRVFIPDSDISDTGECWRLPIPVQKKRSDTCAFFAADPTLHRFPEFDLEEC